MQNVLHNLILNDMFNVKDFKIGIIYKYTSPDGKVYIGQTINENSRKSRHKKEAQTNPSRFYEDIRKYGFENFEYEIIIKFRPTVEKDKLERILNKLETRYIKLYNSTNPLYGYNIGAGGVGVAGCTISEEVKQKNRESQIPITEQDYPHGTKTVEQYDLTNKLVRVHNSIGDAARSITDEKFTSGFKAKSNRISDCCNCRRQTAFDYIWKFQKVV